MRTSLTRFTNSDVTGIIKVDANKVYLSYTNGSGNVIKEYIDYKNQIDCIISQVRDFCRYNNLTLWSY